MQSQCPQREMARAPLARTSMPGGWEERWEREKEQRRRVIEEGGERMEEEERKLKWIMAYNSQKMGAERRSLSEEEEGEEEEEQTFHRLTHPRELFRAMEELRACSLLTDLRLLTDAGDCVLAHSPVLASLCSLILQHLQQREGLGQADRPCGQELSICVGEGVDQAGLAAVLEFAYTGAIEGLGQDTMARVRAAATTLGAERVLQLCAEEDEKRKHGGRTEVRKRTVSPEKQLEMSLRSLMQMWEQGTGCDVVLQVQGQAFPAHRIILAGCSEYFRGMFCSGMRESRQACVQLHSLGTELGAEFGVLLQSCYTGVLQLGWDCVFERVCAALQLQLCPALPLCLHFLHSCMDARSCLDVAAFAEAYGMHTLQEEAEDFVLSHFQEVVATPKFLDLALEKLLGYLSNDALSTPSELAVFRAAIAWLQADPGRMALAPELMAAVRFPLMTFREFREVRAVQLQMEASVQEGVELYSTSFSRFGFQTFSGPELCRVRKPREALVLVGGDRLDQDCGQRRPSRQLWFAHALRSHTGMVKDVEWRMLGEMPETARFRHALGVLDGEIYVFGGCHFYSKYDSLKSAYRYDPAQGRWHRLADLPGNRSNFPLVQQDGCFYAIGGDSDINNNMDTVACYCPTTDRWSFARPLDLALSGHAASLWKGEIFISGGFNCKYQCLVSMFLYHPECGSTYLSEMGGDRALHCMEPIGERLYVAGGVCNLRAFYTDQLECEVYDPHKDCWAALPPLPLPHVGAASAVLEGWLYLLGGYCQDDDSDTPLLHRFDPYSQRWENMGPMPGPNTDIRACVCPLPQHLRQ
ncbi:hypothetical protein AGOR_G00187560 [Albula goreensis]|uniref:BTB domain-containing protein n=1 Tax=Albula goreensis TaxID=1534307 RepID=A0A8T3CTX1_9TELE|nr:hypothetical protein AGOR_G00187560 [Albula goreensis]